MSVSLWEGQKAQALIDAINNSAKVDKTQGAQNAGKALVVGNDGLIGFGNAGLSDDAKLALLECFENVAWTSEDAQLKYNALVQALFGEPVTKTSMFYWDYTMGGNPTDVGFVYRSKSGEFTDTKPEELTETMSANGLGIKTVGSGAFSCGYALPPAVKIPSGYAFEVDFTTHGYSSFNTWYGFTIWHKNSQTGKGEAIVINNNGFCISGEVKSSFVLTMDAPHTIKIVNDMLYCDGIGIIKVGTGSYGGNIAVGVASGNKDYTVDVRRIAITKEIL